MSKVIGMQEMRYLNLFEKVTRIRPITFFSYNGTLIFVVPGSAISRAIGENGKNVRKLNEILGKRVKVISKVSQDNDIGNFLSAVVHPVIFNGLEVYPEEIVINAGKQAKSALIGRDKRRLIELQKISREYLKKEIKII